jgi:hypothetical protein
MTSIGPVAGNNTYVPAQQSGPSPKRVDPDHDGDNDAHSTKASEAAEAAHQALHKVNIQV